MRGRSPGWHASARALVQMAAGTAGAGSVPNPEPRSPVEVGRILRLQLSSYNLHLWAAAVLLEQESSPSCWQRGVGPCHRSRPAAGGRWGAGRRCLQSGGNSSSGTGTNTELSLQKGFCVSAQPHRVLGLRYELLKALGFPIGLRGDKRVSAVCN